MYRLCIVLLIVTTAMQAAEQKRQDPLEGLLSLSRHMSVGISSSPVALPHVTQHHSLSPRSPQSGSLRIIPQSPREHVRELIKDPKEASNSPPSELAKMVPPMSPMSPRNKEGGRPRGGSLSPQSPRGSGSIRIITRSSPKEEKEKELIGLTEAVQLPYHAVHTTSPTKGAERPSSFMLKTPRFMELPSSTGTPKAKEEKKFHEKKSSSLIRSPRIMELSPASPENEKKQSVASRLSRCGTTLSSSTSAVVIHPDTKKVKPSRVSIKSPQSARLRSISPDTQEMLSEYGLWKKPYREMDFKKRTFLINAAMKGESTKVAKILAYDDSGIDKHDKEGKTALIGASENGHRDIVHIILQHDKSRAIYHKDKWGNTALMYGVLCGDIEIVRSILLADRSGLGLSNKAGKTAHDLAVDGGSAEMVKELAPEQYTIGAEQLKKRASLIMASARGDGAMVGALLKYQTKEIYPQDEFGYTPLMYSAMRNDPEIAKTILSFDESGINCRDNEGKTALIHAAECGSLEVVQELLRHDLNVDLEASNGFTAEGFASAEGAVLDDDTIYRKIVRCIKNYKKEYAQQKK